MNNVNNRLRRARKTRAKIAELKVTRLSVHRTNTHIYAQIIAESGDKVIVSASTVEADVRKKVKNGGNVEAAALIGKRIAEKAVKAGVTTEELNTICHDYIVNVQNAIPAPLNYRGFPKSICTPVNHVVCHGIPSESKVLKNGDILNIDVTLIVDIFPPTTMAN